jgi:shikimate dehydrogenase
MRVYGIIGYPLSHSFSQQYFTEKFHREGITDCRYGNFPLASIGEFRRLLDEQPQLRGLNVTIPFKQIVMPLLDETPGIPQTLHACNCIRIDAGKTYGYNTDVTGFEQSLLPRLQPHHTRALVLGSGGAAEAVRFVLQKLKIVHHTVGRQMKRGVTYVYTDLNERIMEENMLIINTTPLGTFPAMGECPAIPYQHLSPRHLLFDLVYNPEKTLFLQKGEERGAATENGLAMLRIQAEESWRIWNTD